MTFGILMKERGVASPSARPSPAPLLRFEAELLDGLDYSRTLAIDAQGRADATVIAQRFCRAHGWRLGALRLARTEPNR